MSEKKDKHSFINDALEKRKQEHQFRTLKPLENQGGAHIIKNDGVEYINFSSNDYLGLSNHPELIKRSNEFTSKYGVGSGASRLVTGTFSIHSELEKKLAEIFNAEEAILFNSGFQANTSILPAVTDRNSLILADKKIHNSLIQGAILSRAAFKRFEHNHYDDLEELLKSAGSERYNRIWIVSETVFSMDGDRNDIDRLIEISEKYNALLYSDDAHAVGVLGEKGLGLNYGKDGIDISLGTFGKAFGSFGAFALCSKEMKDYLINFAGGFIYSTSLPPNVIGAIDAALDLIPEMDQERTQLMKNVEYVRTEIQKLGYDTTASDSQIIPIIIGDEQETIELSNQLKEKGLWVSSIRPPTVEKVASRLRITLSVKHTKEHLDKLLKELADWKRK
ncbi:MAG: 8-amino-7-oxononanoate synthase [Balneola sp.]|nr:8-amino-7-oxononanoate synthase [Balneola sp.]MBO6650175.1 8-amino-7-oxononanoate synthase [Balneola sp.]MBO6710539.1 8-amino-7-oxononanoate synthase [Balneola sp.]MBO6799224.1 8-amino-7-oxononanoate synthase [Balneola sp.]MBO6871063.1 8-amino-7-oxononanoate synthase [Balneola sp.]